MSEIVCGICPHRCRLGEGKTGLCRARKNEGGRNIPASYGRITALSLDPIEKKPLRRFLPGSMILSAGSYGCNLSCPFCQNSAISAADERSVRWRYVSPQEMADMVLREERSAGLAFAYNEPCISPEYIIDCASLLRPHGRCIVLVTNGVMIKETAERLLPWTDAVNIDLKGDEAFYRRYLHGSLSAVKNTIRMAAAVCHTEVTTLVIPGRSDSPAWIAEQAEWLASVDDGICYHLTRYFPHHDWQEPPTPPQTGLRLQKETRKYLRYVYTGNL